MRFRFPGENGRPGFMTTRELSDVQVRDRIYMDPQGLFLVQSTRPTPGNPEFDVIAVLRVP